jgi:hypothetical protein
VDGSGAREDGCFQGSGQADSQETQSRLSIPLSHWTPPAVSHVPSEEICREMSLPLVAQCSACNPEPVLHCDCGGTLESHRCYCPFLPTCNPRACCMNVTNESSLRAHVSLAVLH